MGYILNHEKRAMGPAFAQMYRPVGALKNGKTNEKGVLVNIFL